MKRPPPSSDFEGASSGSKRRRRFSTSDDDDALRSPSNPGFSDAPPLHKIYNSSCRKERPDELFRKDLISAMKLPDNEQLDESEFWDVSDSWKQEWERGVQVPVNSKNVPNPEVRILRDKKSAGFKLPKRLMRTTEDSFFSPEFHVLTDTAAKAESVCKYDMDDLDSQWLRIYNEKREDLGLPLIDEETLELILEDFETQCSNRFQDALKTEKGLGIEYDEDVICDVCRSPDCEEGNEMVFCDSCNICVHQACYGIMAIPEGSWICRPCALNIKPPCILCPNTGGAMKSTSSGEKWAHVSCALWIPEVSIGCPEKMEPIMRISHIPASRWALICTLCRERVGACIQCSVKQCKVAYHVTCAFEHGLEMEMKTTPIDSNEEGVKMQSFCSKHSKAENSFERASSVAKSPKKNRKKKEMKSEKDADDEVDEHNARLQKIRSLEAQFHRYVNVKDTAELLNVDPQVVDFLYYYWVLKRRAKFNKPLLIAKCDEANLLIKQHENLLYSRLKMFVHLRQDLERVRNLCYMVSRREKIFRSYVRIKNEVLEKQVEILSNSSFKLTAKEVEEVMKARVGDSLYDKFYCVELEEDKKEDIANKSSTSVQKAPNPYAKSYSNSIYTRSRRHTTSHSMTDNCDDSCDNEHLDMPKLVKCKSEENVNTLETQTNNSEQSFTHSPFVIKIAPKQNENDIKPNIEHISDLPIVEDINASPDKEAHDISFKSTVEPHEAQLNPENGAKVKKIVSSNEGSNDKHSLCLSDKENINGHTPFKLKKIRGQVEVRHTELKSAVQEFANQKSELYDDDSSLGVANEISSSDGKKNFKIDKRSTRYQMRTRYYSTDNMESLETPFKPTDTTEAEIMSPNPDDSTTNSPSNCSDALSFLTQDSERTEQEKEPIDSTPVPIQRKRRGRPRKILHPNETSIMNFSVIKNEDVLGNEKNSLCSDIIELSNSNESSGFKMSLRHSREHISVKSGEQKQKNKRSVVLKLDHSDAVPLKEANKDILSETVGVESEHTRSSSEWDNEGTSPPRHNSVEQPASTRIIIRLRKDPNRESWKNDSCSSSDVPVAFRIVRNDLDVNCEGSMSEFHSVIKNTDSPQNQTYSVRNDSENKHRYLMRERSVTPRNIKCTFGRS